MLEAIDRIHATPSILVDQATVDRNLQRLATYLNQHQIKLRPHTKTHKCSSLARRQIACGAAGLTVAKVGEAEVMAETSGDLLLAYPISDRVRCERITNVAKRANLHIATDSRESIAAIAEAAAAEEVIIGILVDIDVGYHRTGVQSPASALDLARLVSRHKSLRLDGLFFYPGQIWSPADQQHKELMAINVILSETLDLWRRSGLQATIVSGGSTPTAYQSHLIPVQTEIRPGTYIFNDMNTVRAGFCEMEDCAASLICTIISTTVPSMVVIDAGSKTLTSDLNATAPDSGFGFVCGYPDAKITRLDEEHGMVDVSQCSRPPRLGERVRVVPNHICPCMNLQDRAWLSRDDGSIGSLAIDARGKLT